MLDSDPMQRRLLEGLIIAAAFVVATMLGGLVVAILQAATTQIVLSLAESAVASAGLLHLLRRRQTLRRLRDGREAP